MRHQTTCPFFADGATRRLFMQSDAARQHDYASIRLFTDRLRGDEFMITKRQMDPAPFEGRHRLQLEHLVGLHDALGGAVGKISELVLTTASVVLDINEDIKPELGHELLKNLFRRRHGLWRDLGRLGPLGVRSDPSRSDLGKLLGRQAGLWAPLCAVITRPPIGASATAAVEIAATWARAAVVTWARAAVEI